MKKKIYMAHFFTLFAMLIWGVTFIMTKVVLKELGPLELLFYRFLIAYAVLWIIFPKIKKMESLKEEITFLFLGLTGVSLYFLMENVALQYSTASNVGLLISIAPILTAIVAHFFTKDEKFKKNLLFGFCIAIIGVALVIFNGSVLLKLNPIGDILAVLAAFMWAFYSVILKSINKEYPVIFVVRKTFFYGLLTAGLIIIVTGMKFTPLTGLSNIAIINLVLLGVIASALCYVLWNKAVSIIGAVKASNYIYLIPVITMITAKLVLNEKITMIMIVGSVLIIVGVYIGEKGLKFAKKDINMRTKNEKVQSR